MGTTLDTLARVLRDEGLLAQAPDLLGRGATAVTGVDCDSRHAASGHLFVCKGASFRSRYLEEAVGVGAVAYLCDGSHAADLVAHAPGVPSLVATDGGLRRAMALASLEAWGHPDRDLTTVGITGTKGKSTAVWMLRSILDAGHDRPQAALVGTIATFDGVEDEPSLNTTPEAPDLWRHVANAREAHLPYLVAEVTSQALKYDRVVGLGLDLACFLNIGRDHISPQEHPNFEDYFASKLRIFDQARVAVVNRGTDHLDQVLAAASRCERTLTFSASEDPAQRAAADVWACDARPTPSGIGFLCHTPSWEGRVTIPLPGLFNVENALCAVACCEVLGVGKDQVVAGLARSTVPGRMELVPTASDRLVGVVDFAHNGMAMERFFPAVEQAFPGRRIISVFGATGDKGLARRTELPQAAAPFCDHLVYTSDDPAHERAEDICAAMVATTPAGTPCEVVVDRGRAILRAVDLALAGEGGAVVCMLGRGTESTEHVGDDFLPARLDGDLFREAARLRLGE